SPSSPPGTRCTTSSDSTSSPISVRIAESSVGVRSVCIKSLSQVYDIFIQIFINQLSDFKGIIHTDVGIIHTDVCLSSYSLARVRFMSAPQFIPYGFIEPASSPPY